MTHRWQKPSQQEGDRTGMGCGRKLVWVVGLAAGLAGGLVAVPEVAAAHLGGIDVSNHQGGVNWSAVRSAGVTFAIAKATEGTGFTDAFINQNIAGMKRNGIIPGAYHFGHPGLDATAQANLFTGVVRRANGGTFSGLLQLVLDLEVTDGRSPAQVFAWTQAFVARVRAVTGRPCIIYWFYVTRGSTGFLLSDRRPAARKTGR
jgi:lysozyme